MYSVAATIIHAIIYVMVSTLRSELDQVIDSKSSSPNQHLDWIAFSMPEWEESLADELDLIQEEKCAIKEDDKHCDAFRR